jgi:hypothetical protein
MQKENKKEKERKLKQAKNFGGKLELLGEFPPKRCLE